MHITQSLDNSLIGATMNIAQAMQNRYATKLFAADKKVSDADFAALKSVLVNAPSSVNVQPWHFIIAQDEAGKNRILKGAEGAYSYNAPKVKTASHVVVFCSKIHIDDDYLYEVLEQEDADGRFAKEPSFKETYHGVRSMFVDLHRYELKDTQHWMEKQTYLNLGAFLTSAAAMGIDALPMEGFDLKALDQEFGLREQNLAANVVVTLGYRSADDFNASLPKSRLPEEQLFTQA